MGPHVPHIISEVSRAADVLLAPGVFQSGVSDAEAQTEMQHNFIESKEEKKIAPRGGQRAGITRDRVGPVWPWWTSHQLSICLFHSGRRATMSSPGWIPGLERPAGHR